MNILEFFSPQKTAEEQTRLFLQQLDMFAKEALASPNGSPHQSQAETPESVCTAAVVLDLSPKQTKDLQQTLQPALQETLQQVILKKTKFSECIEDAVISWLLLFKKKFNNVSVSALLNCFAWESWFALSWVCYSLAF